MEKGGKEPGKESSAGFNQGQIPFKGVMKNLGDLMKQVSRLIEEGGGQVERQGEFGAPGGSKGIYGFTIKTGLGGDKPVVREFGNVRPARKGAVVEEVRDPIVDVFDEEEVVTVVAEIPGVEESELELQVKDDVLLVSTSGDKKYQTEVLLPQAFAPVAMESSYRNGVLKVTFTK